MGSGRWDAGSHLRSTKSKMEEHGTTFAYSASVASGAVPKAAHATMDPKVVAGAASPFVGSVMRESCDSDEHPETLPIAVFFDVTGSMGQWPQVLQSKLPKLYGLLLAKGYVEHPQVLFGAVGDVYSDRVPLQVGQFESDNRADENLENIYLEGNGGGGNHESYDLAAYFMARHTHTDAWEKRGKKGYCFFIGDERAYENVDRKFVTALIGDGLEADIPTPEIIAELQEKWEVFYLYCSQASYSMEEVLVVEKPGHSLPWRQLLGQNAIVLDDAEAVCETIALTIGLCEGSIDLDAGMDDLADVGSDKKAIESASRALATVGAAVGGGSATGDADGDIDDGDGADRL